MTRSRTRRKPSAVYSPSLGMLFIPVLYILFWVQCTNSVDIKRILKYVGVRYQPDTPYYLWLFVRYDDSALGYVGVPPLSFNANVSLQKELKKIVPESEWSYLQKKYGFGFRDPIMQPNSGLICLSLPKVLYSTWVANDYFPVLFCFLSPLYIFNINTSCRLHSSLLSCPFHHSRRCLLHFSLPRTAKTTIPMYEKFKSNALVLIIVQTTNQSFSDTKMMIISAQKFLAKDWMLLSGPRVFYIPLTIPLAP